MGGSGAPSWSLRRETRPLRLLDLALPVRRAGGELGIDLNESNMVVGLTPNGAAATARLLRVGDKVRMGSKGVYAIRQPAASLAGDCCGLPIAARALARRRAKLSPARSRLHPCCAACSRAFHACGRAIGAAAIGA